MPGQRHKGYAACADAWQAPGYGTCGQKFGTASHNVVNRPALDPC